MSSQHNYLLLVEYDGSGYSGWQKQPGAVTVQGEIEKAFDKLGLKVNALAAGRTDKGAHALGQAVGVSFKKDTGKDYDLRYRLNAVLPKKISIISAEKKNSSFNPRFEAKRKKYRYVIWNRPWRSVWRGMNAWHVTQPLDTARMIKASRFLLGSHDFSAFDASGSTQPNKQVNVESIDIVERDGKITVTFTADRFLYKMVRNIVGTLVEAGKGNIDPRQLKDILLCRNRRAAGPTAPAKGLFLEEIMFYEKQKRKA